MYLVRPVRFVRIVVFMLILGRTEEIHVNFGALNVNDLLEKGMKCPAWPPKSTFLMPIDDRMANGNFGFGVGCLAWAV